MSEQTYEEQATAEDFDFANVDTPDADETEEVEVTEEKAKEKKPAKEKSRGDLPEGYVTPVGLAHELGKRGLQKNKAGEVLETVPPQQVYSYIKSAPKDHPFPGEMVKDSLGNERFAVKLDDALAWWVAKNERAEARKQNAADKAAKKAQAKAKKDEEATEAEAADELVEAEEAE